MNVQQAEAQLQQAKAAEAEKAREALRGQLADIRKQLRVARASYQDLSKRIRNGENQVARIQAQIDELTTELTLLMEQRPEVADALPNDAEVVDWRQTHQELINRRETLIQQRTRATSAIPPLVEAVKFEGNFGLIANLERAQHNLVRRIKGEPIGASWEGGVYRVL